MGGRVNSRWSQGLATTFMGTGFLFVYLMILMRPRDPSFALAQRQPCRGGATPCRDVGQYPAAENRVGRAIRGGPRGPRCRDRDRHSGPDFRKRPSAQHRHAFRPSSACGGGAEVFGTHRLRPTLTQSGHQAQAVSHSPSRSASVAPDSPTEPIAFMRLRARCGSALRRRRPLLPPTQRASSSQLAHRR